MSEAEVKIRLKYESQTNERANCNFAKDKLSFE